MRYIASIIVVFLLLFPPTIMKSQSLIEPTGTCGSEFLHNQMLQTDSAYFQKNEALEKLILKKMQEKKASGNEKSGTVYTIPVVVHVIHSSGIPIGTAENRSYMDVVELIQGMNDDFSHASGLTYTNPNYGVDTDIQFCLAAVDPDGNSTSGIDRHADDDRTVFDWITQSNNPNPGLHETYHWDPNEYYNIYLIKQLIGAAGFASFAPSHGGMFDGAVMRANVSDDVWTHELGHGMNLFHPFQGGCPNDSCHVEGDKVCDTPPQILNGSCPTNPCNTCTTDEDDLSTQNPYRPVANGGIGDQPDPLQNYMGYALVGKSAFTIGQKDRMRIAIEDYRTSYLSSTVCEPPTTNDATVLQMDFRDTTCGIAMVGANAIFTNLGSGALTSLDVELRIDGILKSTINWTGNLNRGEVDTVEFAFVAATAGVRNICLKTNNPNGMTDESTGNDELCEDKFVDFYCPSMSNNASFNWIESVTIGNVQNGSGGNGGYANFTDSVFQVDRGYEVEYHFEHGFTGIVPSDMIWDLWCDLNQDYDFDDPGELIKTIDEGNPIVNGIFLIPATANLGQTRFRVVMSLHSSTGSTGSYSHGETEDYTIDIQAPTYVNEAKILNFTPWDTCSAAPLEVGAQVVLQNLGTANLTSADVDFKIDATTISSYTWTGNLAFGEKDTFQTGRTKSRFHNM